MAEMAKVTINWTGFSGAPGFTNLYFRDFAEQDIVDQIIVDGSLTKTNDWLTNVILNLPPTVTVRVNPQVEIVESTTGALLRYMTGTTPAARPGTRGGAYSAASGAVVNWYTNTVIRGRRLRGRTFLVPFGGGALSATGDLDDAALTQLRTTTGQFIAETGAGDLGVWSRPSAPGADDGSWAMVTSFTIPDKAAVLRSRRD